MLDGLILASRLRRLERNRRRDAAKYARLAESAANEADEAPFVFERQMRIWEIDDAVQQLECNMLLRQAHRYLLPIPPIDKDQESWERSSFTNKWQLTRKAFNDLRNAVRAERKARHDAWQSRIVWISSATGLIGAFTGLISVTFFHASK